MAYDEQPLPGLETEIAPAPRPAAYLGAVAVALLLLVTAGALEVVPWPVAILGAASLGVTKVPGGQWFALGGGALFAFLIVLTQVSGVGRTGYVERAASTDQVTQTTQPVAATGSLGVTLREIPDSWNALEHPPAITGGLVRETAAGPYDSFRYRFDSAASLAGAFDPNDDSVHALLASVGLFHEAAASFYLHVCFMLHPYSQECIDGYLESGLGGRPISDYAGVDHSASWEIGDQLWKLEIADNVQSIRVLGPAVR